MPSTPSPDTADFARFAFDHTPAQLIVGDFSAVEERFTQLRAEGVRDFFTHLRDHPSLIGELWQRVRIVDANQQALAVLGATSTSGLHERLLALAAPPMRQIIAYQLSSLWDHRRQIEEQYFYTGEGGETRSCLMRCVVPGEDGEPCLERVMLMLVDTTTSSQAITARLGDQAALQEILARANILLWGARVSREGDRFLWKINVPQQSYKSPLLRLATAIDKGGLWEEQHTPDWQHMVEVACSALRDGLPSYRHEFRIIADGRTHWMSEEVGVQALAKDEWSLVGVISDVTSRREAEEALSRNAEHLQRILERADCMLWQARVVQSPEGALDWQMYLPESVLHRKLFGDHSGQQALMWDELHVPQLGEMTVRSREAILSGAPGYEQEFRAYRDGTAYWLHERASIMPAKPGEWVLVGTITDITGRREAEAALANEKERLSVTLRAMTEAVITTDIEGVVQFINHAALALTRRTTQETVGRHLSQSCPLVHALSGEPVELPLTQVLRDGVLVEIPPHTRMNDREGGSILVAGRCAPVRDAASRTTGAVLVFRNITEQQRLEEELQRASKLESVGILAGGIAHDFNNILTAVMGNLTLAQLDARAYPELERCLHDAQLATVRARDLTQQLLTFAKGGDPVRMAVQLPGIVAEVARFALHGSRVTCDFHLPESLWSANADKGQLSQIVQNLVINAVQAMPTGGSILIAARNETIPAGSLLPLEPGDYVQLAIEDSGPGIPPEHLPRIFDPYFTTKQQGSGLGLATVYSIVRKHQGHISVESHLGRGTKFLIWLPAVQQPGPTAAPLPSASHPVAGRALFMDDEAPIRKLASRLLERLGLDVETVADGRAAVEAFATAHREGRGFDVVIMDLTVPGSMGGQEALEEMRAIDPHVKAIVSSGYSSDPVMASFRACGFAGMVAKPYQVEEFSRVVRSVLEAGN